jgi:hypothetical protein
MIFRNILKWQKDIYKLPEVGMILDIMSISLISYRPSVDYTPPNIVLILIDDIGYGDLGCYGSTIQQTPNIDKLAATGIRFTDFHSNGCVCSPTRAALLTGQYQQRSGIESAIGFTKDAGIPLSKTTIAELLAQDHGEVRDLAGDQPEIVTQYQKEFGNW